MKRMKLLLTAMLVVVLCVVCPNESSATDTTLPIIESHAMTVDTSLSTDAPVVVSYKQAGSTDAFKSTDGTYFYKEEGGITFAFTPRADIKYTVHEPNPTDEQITDSITLTTTDTVYAVDTAGNVST